MSTPFIKGAHHSRKIAIDAKRLLKLGALFLFTATKCFAQLPLALDSVRCGELVTIETRDDVTVRYAYAPPLRASDQGDPVTLLLLPGGTGRADLDEGGCARGLKQSALIRSIPLFNAAGIGTALLDTPSDHQDENGLGAFRIEEAHAHDIGDVIEDLRTRMQGEIWILGTSRGTISAVNAAARLSGASAPDGIVLTSALMSKQKEAKDEREVQTVFDLRLEAIVMPVLVVGHVNDTCVRTPSKLMRKIIAKTHSTREQVVSVSGGPGKVAQTHPDVCTGLSSHGFIGQEAEVAAGIVRFIRGDKF